MPTAQINDTTINFQVDDFTDPWRNRSSVKTIFLHHAFLRGLDSLTGWIPRLARHYRVVRIDSRGFGGSSAPPPPFEMTMQQLADDALGLLDYLEIERVHYVGVSSGGIAGQMLAATRPDRIESLTLCDSPHKLNQAVKAKLSLGERSISDAMRKYGFNEWRRRTLDSTLDPNRLDPRIGQWQLERQYLVPEHVSISQEASLEVSDTASILRDIHCPTLLIGGDRSVFVPLEMLIYMAGQIPDSRVHVFPNVGSTLSMTYADPCAKSTFEFLQTLDER
jgi:3-oxoadipate enol-lactonase